MLSSVFSAEGLKIEIRTLDLKWTKNTYMYGYYFYPLRLPTCGLNPHAFEKGGHIFQKAEVTSSKINVTQVNESWFSF